MASRHARAAETLEADAIEDARLLGESIISGFKPSASIKLLDKNEFVKKYAEVWHEGDREAAYKKFTGTAVYGSFDTLKNEAFYTFREVAPSYKAALDAAVHEVYGHGYIHEMKAVREGLELKKKMMLGEASELETSKAILADKIFQMADEGFAHWVSGKADEQLKSDKKRFAKYGQTRLDAWALLEHEPSNKTSDTLKETYDNDVVQDGLLIYITLAKLGRAIYQDIEKKFGEKAVLSAAKACLDVPLDEIISDEIAELHIASKDTPTPGMADALCLTYVEKRLEAISDYSGPYSNEADFETKARELANNCEKPTSGVDENRYLGIEMDT